MFVKIFGGSGFVGGHLSRHLLSLGHHVTVCDVKKPRITGAMVKDPTGTNPSWYNAAHFIGCDVTDYKQVYYSVDKGDCVVNLAAVAQFGDAEQKPHIASGINITGAVNIMHACIENKAAHLVYASTGSVYSMDSNVPIDESQPLGSNSIYGMSKLWAETALRHYADRIPLTVLRLPHIVGPGKFWGANTFIVKLLAGERPTIFGDGGTKSDFTYVGDVVQAIVNSLKKQVPGVFNIGSGKCRSTKEFFDLARMYCDRMNIEPLYLPPRVFDFPVFEYDIGKARKGLGYSPEYDLEHAVEATVRDWGQWI